MSRVDRLLDWLRGQPAACVACGSVLVSIAGNGVAASVCPNCDVTPGVEARSPETHDAVHYLEIPGCPECIQWRRARI
jgi:phage FluMu protein Com